jgi:hypothetical protein
MDGNNRARGIRAAGGYVSRHVTASHQCDDDRAASGATDGTADALWRVRTMCDGRAGCNPAPVVFLAGGAA